MYDDWKLIDWHDIDGDKDSWFVEFEVEAPDGHREKLNVWFGIAGKIEEILHQELPQLIAEAIAARNEEEKGGCPSIAGR